MSLRQPPRGLGLTLPSRVLFSCAGILGTSGIAVGAAGSHAGGGDFARLASTFLLIHAVAVIGLGVVGLVAWRAWPFYTVATLLVLGAGAFGSDLAILAFTGSRLVGFMAPVGGTLMIVGWVALFVLPWFGQRSRPD